MERWFFIIVYDDYDVFDSILLNMISIVVGLSGGQRFKPWHPLYMIQESLYDPLPVSSPCVSERVVNMVSICVLCVLLPKQLKLLERGFIS